MPSDWSTAMAKPAVPRVPCCVPIKTSPPCSNRSVTPWQVGLNRPDGNTFDERNGTSAADGVQPGQGTGDQRGGGRAVAGAVRSGSATALEAVWPEGRCRVDPRTAGPAGQCGPGATPGRCWRPAGASTRDSPGPMPGTSWPRTKLAVPRTTCWRWMKAEGLVAESPPGQATSPAAGAASRPWGS